MRHGVEIASLCQPEHDTLLPSDRQAEEHMTKHSVYVVDDDASFRSYLTTMLAGSGYEPTGMETGSDLFAKLKVSGVPSIILLDVLLPDSDGIQVMAKIKEMGINTPVI